MLHPLSGLKGVKPPLVFGERTRDCAPGHTGKEGPYLTMTGVLGGFTELQRLCGFLRKYTWAGLESEASCGLLQGGVTRLPGTVCFT